eukprot:GEMP01068801.1.p1 GENE.GEMP01068801.1~~GEMP01068801.1.p1  ORF type:complete len:211 (-),score=41.78 GEMP01068801.1:327-959(-)
MSSIRCFLMLACFPPAVEASLLDGMFRFRSTTHQQINGAEMVDAMGSTHLFTVAEDEPLPASDECLCDVTNMDSCVCNEHCDEEEQGEFCEWLLGPCICTSNANVMSSQCECIGWCSTKEIRAEMCEFAEGCEWRGFYCGTYDGDDIDDAPAMRGLSLTKLSEKFDRSDIEHLVKVRKELRPGQGLHEESDAEAEEMILHKTYRIYDMPG